MTTPSQPPAPTSEHLDRIKACAHELHNIHPLDSSLANKTAIIAKHFPSAPDELARVRASQKGDQS